MVEGKRGRKETRAASLKLVMDYGNYLRLDRLTGT
jgi:hypothetical protein